MGMSNGFSTVTLNMAHGIAEFFSSKGIKGTGLGLFISNKIVDKHGGDIEVESKVKEGTTFRVHLPIVSIPAEITGKNQGE